MKFITTDKVYNPIGPFSQGTVVGNMAFISGIGGLEMDGKAASLDVEQQTRKAMENCKHILEAGGFTFKDVVKLVFILLISMIMQKLMLFMLSLWVIIDPQEYVWQ